MDTPEDPAIGAWLDQLGLGRYRALFAAQEIDTETLAEVTEPDLERWGIPFGPRKRLARAIAALRDARPGESVTLPEPTRSDTAERRQITVMFCDMVDSSSIAARLDPEDVREVMRAYRDICNAAIARYEGFVVRYFGDGVLACFGWPTAHEDDAERAVRAGQTVVQEMRRSEPLPGVTPKVRIGIATGLAVVGDLIGEGAAQETSLVGDTPNLAARLQNFAEANTLIIAAGTRRLLGNLFNLKELGPLQLKGMTAPITAFQVMGEAMIESRYNAVRNIDVGRGIDPGDLIGRASEMALLLDRWQQARLGEGQAVLLSGQAGIGKSTLVEALLAALADQPHGLQRLQCSSYHRNSALHPLIQLVHQTAGIEADDAPDRRMEKLVMRLGEPGRNILPAYAELLSLPTEGLTPALDPDPQLRREQILDAVIERLVWNASFRPVLFVIEDAHWIDPTTRDLIARFLKLLPRLPILMVVTFRPDDDPGWGEHACITRLQLNRLSRRSCAAMIGRVAGGKALPGAVLDAILAKTDGVPLFVEELTKMLLESEQLRETADTFVLNSRLPQLAVPTTLQDSLMARLDRLGAVKQIAQIGAVIGRDFAYALLAALVPTDDAGLQSALQQLADAELIFSHGEPPDASYSFKHALVQDAAYDSLLRSHRQLWHGRIAAALLERMPALAAAQPEVIARHYAEAGMTSQAIDWLRRAGELAIRRSADIEATGHVRRALELLATLPQNPWRDARELDLRAAISGSLFATQGYGSAEAETNCNRAYALCQSVGTAPRLFPTLWGRFTNFLVRADIPRALAEAQRFAQLAALEGDAGLVSMAHRNLGVAHLSAGEPVAARTHLDQAAALLRPEHRAEYTFAYGLDPLVTVLSGQALVKLQLGEADAAEAAAAEALREARETGHFASLAYALMRVGLFTMLRDQPDALAPLGAELVRIAQRRDARTWGLYGEILSGWCAARGGALDAGLSRIERGIDGIHALNGSMFISLLRFEQAALLVDGGQMRAALSCLEAARPMLDPGGQRIGESELPRLRALALHGLGAPAAEIAAELSRAQAVARTRAALDVAKAAPAARLARAEDAENEHL
jgi:class 3 adenylate cyclase/tetratricopeptide (TPR) repeat protein/energy-coupling factor transporter ATP-binding protein EcfA2